MAPVPEHHAVDLALPLEIASVRLACEAVVDGLLGSVCHPRDKATIELVIEEAVMNVLRHAFDEPAGQVVRLRAWVDAGVLSLQFEDTGRPFDPTAAALPMPAESIEQARPGGLGILLMRKRARSMSHSRAEGRNVLTITLGLQPA